VIYQQQDFMEQGEELKLQQFLLVEVLHQLNLTQKNGQQHLQHYFKKQSKDNYILIQQQTLLKKRYQIYLLELGLAHRV